AVDSPSTVENPAFTDALYRLPDATPTGTDPTLLTLNASADGGAMPLLGRSGSLEPYDANGDGEPDYYFGESSDGRLRMFRFTNGGAGGTTALEIMASSEPQGYGVGGVKVVAGGAFPIVAVSSSSG